MRIAVRRRASPGLARPAAHPWPCRDAAHPMGRASCAVIACATHSTRDAVADKRGAVRRPLCRGESRSALWSPAACTPTMPDVILDDFARRLELAAGRLGARPARRSSPDAGPRGPAMRLDFDFHGGGGFVVARKDVALDDAGDVGAPLRAPRRRRRGTASSSSSPTRAAGTSGGVAEDAFDLPAEWRRSTHPEPRDRVRVGTGGRRRDRRARRDRARDRRGPGRRAARVWIGDLSSRIAPAGARRSCARRARCRAMRPTALFDDPPPTSWRSVAGTGPQRLEVDFQGEREYGGLVDPLGAGRRAARFSVETSDDGATWTTVHTTATPTPTGAGSTCRTPASATSGSHSQASVAGRGFGIAGARGPAVRVLALDPDASSGASRAERAARTTIRAGSPREQTYWTPVGLPDGDTCAIMNEEGMVEVDRGTFSIEPFLLVGGRLLDVGGRRRRAGARGRPASDPVVASGAPTTRAPHDRVRGRAATAAPSSSSATGSRTRRRAPRVRLFAAIRPFQVNPPWQAFGALGGVQPDPRARRRRGTVVPGSTRARAIVPLAPASGFGAAAFEQGERGRRPPERRRCRRARRSTTRSGIASGALRSISTSRRARADDVVSRGAVRRADAAGGVAASRSRRRRRVRARRSRDWRERARPRRRSTLPARRARPRATRCAPPSAHVLSNRDGPALQPGPRRYTRSWIRDGAIMAAALLRVGRTEEARAFVRWYAAFQAPDGNVPCCVDRERTGLARRARQPRRARLRGDGVLPLHAATAASSTSCGRPCDARSRYLEALRATRLGPECETAEKRARHGLLPESASHEGYLAHPVHAYWDDFWALRGLRDAARMAAMLGDARRGARGSRRSATRSARALRASIATDDRRARHRLRAGVGRVGRLRPDRDRQRGRAPRRDGAPAARRRWPRPSTSTWRASAAAARARSTGTTTPPTRSASSARSCASASATSAAELAEFLLDDRRPRAWNQWPEISWRDPRSPGHIGDVPHTWIGAEYVLAFRTMLAYERAADDALVLAAGVADAWLDDGPVVVDDLPTYHGALAFTLRRVDAATIVLSLRGALTVPAGGIVVRPPLPGPLVAVELDGVSCPTSPPTASSSVAARRDPDEVLGVTCPRPPLLHIGARVKRGAASHRRVVSLRTAIGARTSSRRQPMTTRGIAYAPFWRVVSGVLVAISRGGLLVMVVAMWFFETQLDNPLRLIRTFVVVSLAPGIAAWLLARAFAAVITIEAGVLAGAAPRSAHRDACDVGRSHRAVADPGAHERDDARSPLGTLFSVRLGGGSLARSTPSPTPARRRRCARPRAIGPRSMVARDVEAGRPGALDRRPFLKFGVVALVPTLPLFRLHQWIAYGGTFGEYYTYGLQAYVLGFAVFWATFVVDLVLYAAILRAAAESQCWSLRARRRSASASRARSPRRRTGSCTSAALPRS